MRRSCGKELVRNRERGTERVSERVMRYYDECIVASSSMLFIIYFIELWQILQLPKNK